MDGITILWLAGYGLIVSLLSVYGLHRFWMVWTYYRCKRRRIEPQGALAVLPRVTVQLPVFNEVYVVERLLRAVAALDYPRELLELQILDDSTDETTRLVAALAVELRGQGFDVAQLHRVDRAGYKAGALQAGLRTAKGELIAIFDADFVPPPEILRATVHYFSDPQVGMIQTRWGHLNRNYNLLTRIQALMLDGHLLIEQTARNRSGRFFNFNGTAGVWRKAAIEDAGGWQHDTLTEDLDLSYRAQLRGWKFVFVPEVVVPAELPVDMNSFKAQQHRWAKGAIQTCCKLLPVILRSPLPRKIKFEAMIHLVSNFAYLLLALLALLVRPEFQRAGFHWGSFLAIDAPIFCLATLSIFVFYGTVLVELRKPWYLIPLYVPILIATGIGLCLNNARAVLEAVCGHQSEFTRTPKYGIRTRRQAWRGKQYAAGKSLVLLLELVLAGYYAWFIWYGWRHQLWVSLPFFTLFFVGFGYAGLVSLFQSWPARWGLTVKR
ncbi:MAG: glycosyltransferase family 2 protein [Verrucomicrobiales bacterium]|jgi:cellulose synthase/poly-beta-1,6-N-acetylglucosamine synthase-like glycosyltransferase|nr:glycosyltransferase family 2 protein [Verrucomicrobiales bacterium]